jgi:uncharacterized integral membrane protein
MPWRMIGLVLLLVLVAAFATLNLSNRTDISLGLHVFREVPIFLSLLVAFLAGILVMVPFTVGRGRRTRRSRTLDTDRLERGGGGRQAGAAELPEPAAPEPQTEAPAVPARTAARGKAKSPGSRKTKAR